jgi:hypothetical protein
MARCRAHNKSERILPHLFTAPLTVAELFSDPFRFAVPSYQRRYSWTVKEAGQLLDDMQAAVGADAEPVEADYFLGAILLTDAYGSTGWDRGLPKTPRLVDIVDGQQRLVTLAILLSVLRDIEDDPTPESRELARMISLPDGEPGRAEAYRIQLRGPEGAFLVDNVLGSGACHQQPELASEDQEGESAILSVRNHFLGELAPLAPEDRHRLTAYILKCCQVVAIVTTDIDHGHRMFSVLNDRGRPLARKDIIKAEVLGDVAADQMEPLLAHWSEMERRLGADFDTFFSHVRTVHGQAKLPIIAGIRAVREDAGGSERFLKDVLMPLAEAFELIRRAAHSGAPQSPEIARRLVYLGWLGSSEWVPPTLLWLSRYRDTPGEILRFLEVIDRFSYCLRLLCIGTGKRAARFAGVLPAIARGTVLDPERSPCLMTRDDHRHITSNLRNLHARHPQTSKLVLLRLNDELAGSPQNLDPSEWTVEHVLPQSPSRNSRWRLWFPDPNERDNFTQSLGNLVLVRRSQNDRASNQELERKQAIYFDGPHEQMPAVTREIGTAREWGPAQIREREERFLRILSSIWGLELTGASSGSSQGARGLANKRKAS